MSSTVAGRLHNREWWDAVVQARQALGLRPSPEAELERTLRELGRQVFLSAVKASFQNLACYGLPRRYFAFFASCVLTHHAGTRHWHAAPAGLIPSLLAEQLTETEEGYHCILYRPRPTPHPHPGWESVTPLYGFEVHWPGVVYLALNEAECDRISETEEEHGISLTWLLWPAEVIDKASGKLMRGAGQVPLLCLPDSVVGIAFARSGPVYYQEPRVLKGALGELREETFVRQWQAFLKRWAELYTPAFPALAFPAGRPKSPLLGATFTEDLLATYREDYTRERPSTDWKKEKLRNSALRRVKRRWRDIPHEPLPRQWWLEVESK